MLYIVLRCKFKSPNTGKNVLFIELPKFYKDKPDSLISSFEKWLYLLKFGDLYQKESDMIPKELLDEKGIPEAIQAMQYVNSDAHVRDLIESREKYEHDQASLKEFYEEESKKNLEKGLKQGREQGIEREKIEIAKKLIKSSSMNDQEILNITQLDLDIIKKLRLSI
ncbi:MAG: hypothetical protein COB02_16725 [Candidatus Cloacimonadota bacterium]|nr:MAG: hypothetical protein COB02_16725 [Candidatus Cloacimonadota bacterium]